MAGVKNILNCASQVTLQMVIRRLDQFPDRHTKGPLRVTPHSDPLRSAEIGDQPYWKCSASRTPTLPGPNKRGCAIDHILRGMRHFVMADTRINAR